MQVCDKHPTRKAVDSIEFKIEGHSIDMCDECRYAVLEMFAEEVSEQPKKGLLDKVLGKN